MAIDPQLLELWNKQQAEAEAEKEARKQSLMQELGQRAQAPTSVNLSPFAALADSMTGGNITKGVASQAAEADAYTKRNNDLLDQLHAVGKTTGAITPSSLLGDKQGAINSRQQDAQDQAAFTALSEKVGKLNDAAVDGMTQANRMQAAFDTKDPREVGPAMNELARIIQGVKGTMSEGDVNRSFFEDYDTKVQKWLTKFRADGKLSDEALAPVMAQLGRFKQALAQTTDKKLKRLETTYVGNPAYATATKQLKAGGAFNYASDMLKDATGTAPVAPSGGLPGMTDIDAEMARRQKAPTRGP